MANYYTGIMPQASSSGGTVPPPPSKKAPKAIPLGGLPSPVPVNGPTADTSKAYSPNELYMIQMANDYINSYNDAVDSQRELDVSGGQVNEQQSQWMNPDLENQNMYKPKYNESLTRLDSVSNMDDVTKLLESLNMPTNPALYGPRNKAMGGRFTIPNPLPGTVEFDNRNKQFLNQGQPTQTPPPATSTPPSTQGFSNSFTPQTPPPTATTAPQPAQSPAPQVQQSNPSPTAQPYTAPTTRSMSGPSYIQSKLSSGSSTTAPTTPKAQPETQIKSGLAIPVNTKSGLGF